MKTIPKAKPSKPSPKPMPAKKGGKKVAKKPAKPRALNVRQIRFAELVAGGMVATQAYAEAGYSKDPRIAEAHAWRLVENGGVKALITQIIEKRSRKFELKREELARHLLGAIMTPIDEIDGSSPFAQENIFDGKGGRRIKSMGKVESARLLCEMMGWKEPEQHVIESGPKTLEAVRERARLMAAPLGRVIDR
ncbi:MAG: Terminase small subunit [Verrucomicrobiota bacterium]|jgi:hypothetical protein